MPDSGPVERRALSYFQDRAASELGGVCSPELWSKFILPVAHHDLAIRHAVVALVTLHEEYTNLQHPFPTGSQSTFLHYGKAVNELLRLKSVDRPDAVDVALVGCIIFAAVETLRGHYYSAWTHVLSGRRILDEESKTANTMKARPIPRYLLEEVIMRIETQVMSMGERSLMPFPISRRLAKPAIPPVFESSQEAFYILEVLRSQILHFLAHAARLLAENDSRPEAFGALAPELIEFEDLFRDWEQSFNSLLKLKPDISRTGFGGHHPAVLLLNILRTGMSTTFPIARGRHQTECEWDVFTEDFEKIVDWAEAYIRTTSSITKPATQIGGSSLDSDVREHQAERGGSLECSRKPSSSTRGPRRIIPKPDGMIRPTFSMTTGIVASLYTVGARCRDPRIRRKALHLLQTCNMREGLWDSYNSAMIIGRVIDMEESNALQELRKTDKHATITRASHIPTTVRVVVMGVNFGRERSGEIRYQVNEPCPDEGIGMKTRLVKEIIHW